MPQFIPATTTFTLGLWLNLEDISMRHINWGGAWRWWCLKPEPEKLSSFLRRFLLPKSMWIQTEALPLTTEKQTSEAVPYQTFALQGR
jgi:hypothetical protein